MKTMKISNIIAAVAGCAFALVSCSEINTDYQYLFPEEYNRILYIQNSGTVRLELPDLASSPEYTYSFNIIKAGSDPDLEAEAVIRTLSEEEVVETYGTGYKLLPSDTWSMDNAPIQFTAEDMSKTVDIAFRPAEIKKLLDDSGTSYCLPVELGSSNSTVNEEKNRLLLEIAAVTTPRLAFRG